MNSICVFVLYIPRTRSIGVVLFVLYLLTICTFLLGAAVIVSLMNKPTTECDYIG